MCILLDEDLPRRLSALLVGHEATTVPQSGMSDELPIRLGNLASNLAHISSFAKGAKNTNAVERLLYESRFFIEWTAGEAEIETAAELVELQVQLSG